jgi:hypothetical protein
MGYIINKTEIAGGSPIFIGAYENAQGGFTLDNSVLTAGAKVPVGSVMGFDESTRKANVLVVAELYEDATDEATSYKVKKGHLFTDGKVLGAEIEGAAYAITEIDTSNADYDVITVGTTLGVALDAGVVLFESAASGADKCALAVTPKGLLYSEVTVGANEPCAVCIRGTVYERRIPVVPDAVKAYIPNIIFSQSY